MRSSPSEPVARRLSAIAGFYRYATDEDLIDRSPVAGVRRPKVADDSQTTGLDRDQLRAVLALARQRAAAGAGQSSRDLARPCSPCSPTTACAIGEALAADATDLGTERGHRVLHITRKGGRRATVVLAPVTARALDDYLTGRDTGPLFITGGGRRYDEPAAFRLVRRLARAAGLDCAERLSPHSLRHAFVTLALDAGVSLRDVQDAAGHADPPHHPALRPGPAQPRPGSHLRRCGVPRRGWSVGSVSRRDAAARRARRTTPRTPESAA
jgi:integrase/recombinase XerD